VFAPYRKDSTIVEPVIKEQIQKDLSYLKSIFPKYSGAWKFFSGSGVNEDRRQCGLPLKKHEIIV